MKKALTVVICALSILSAWVHIYEDKPLLNAVEIDNRIYAFGYNSDSTERYSGRWVNQSVFILSENGDYITENPISDFIGVVQDIIIAADNTFYCSAIAATRESYPDSYYAAVMIIDTLGNIVRSQSLSFDNTLRFAVYN
jgi:hypothetical protein